MASWIVIEIKTASSARAVVLSGIVRAMAECALDSIVLQIFSESTLPHMFGDHDRLRASFHASHSLPTGKFQTR